MPIDLPSGELADASSFEKQKQKMEGIKEQIHRDKKKTSEAQDDSGVAGHHDEVELSWAANKRFEKVQIRIPESSNLRNDRARSRLYRSHILQVNTRWKALAEIYTMHSFAPFWNPQSKIRRKNAKFDEGLEKNGNSIVQSRKNVGDAKECIV